MKPRQKRFVFVLTGLVGVVLAVWLVIYALGKNTNLYFTPTQIYNKEAPNGRSFRIGGLIKDGSLKRNIDGLTVQFVMTDTHKDVSVVYTGILPDLFKEGKSAVVRGKMEADGVMHAEEVLAKHDETYMPPEAAEALKKAAAANAADAAAAASAIPAVNAPATK